MLKQDGDLMITAEPLELAERICRRLVDEVDATTDGTLLLHANPALAWAIDTVLVKKGAMVSELRYVVRRRVR